MYTTKACTGKASSAVVIATIPMDNKGDSHLLTSQHSNMEVDNNMNEQTQLTMILTDTFYFTLVY